MYNFKAISSLEKVFLDKPVNARELKEFSLFKNEIFSFQLAGEVDEDLYACKMWLKLEIDSPLKEYIKVREVGYVPSDMPCFIHECDDDFLSKEPGLYPDPLFIINCDEVAVRNHRNAAFWVTVEPKGEIFGEYPITFKFSYEGNVVSEISVTATIIDCELPSQELINTGWFHGDSLAVHHNVEILSDEYYEVFEKYLETYVKFGHNMILTPVFTPPLDTKIGSERLTNQLVSVTLANGGYEFCFKELGRFIDLCIEKGIKYFEISHLFTQWGANHAPKIMATVDGEYKRIFGWETDALSDEYKNFLDTFLVKLVAFLKEKGVYENCYFHVSDEPVLKNAEQYKRVKAILDNHIPADKIIDALSNFEFYQMGIVSKPIVGIDHINPFIDSGVPGLWAYYCCAQNLGVTNRYMAMPSYRNRILGYQLYKYDIKGFLQWGYNFWFSQHAVRAIDPYANTTADFAFPSGDAYLVYPIDEKNEVVESLRIYVFNEALQDLRALKLLENYIGREEVLKKLEEIEYFGVYPRNSEYILNLREWVNEEIKKLI